jgi:hypothetical protein
MSACIESHFCLFACSDTSTVSYCKSQRSPPSGTYIKYPTRRIKLHASSDLYFIQHRVSYWNKSQTATQCSSADTSAILHHLPMVALRNMQTFSHSFGRKRPLSPEVHCNRNFEGKRRATTNHKPILQVDTMLQMDKMLPYRRTPEQSFFPRTSPFLSQSYAPYPGTVEFPTSTSQNMMTQTAADWTQYTGAMHTTLSTNNMQYHSETGFLESCKSSLESSSTYSVPFSFSGTSSSYNPFAEFCSSLPSVAPSSSPAQTDTNTEDPVNAAIMRLRKLQDALVEQSNIIEEVMQALQGSCKSRNRP